MDGVNAVSVGRRSILCSAALVEHTYRVQVKPQPAIFIHNGSRLERRGRRPALEHRSQEKTDASGDPYSHVHLADRILDRESLLSVTARKFTVRRGWFDRDSMYRTDHNPTQKHNRLFYQKRGV